jgi:hypothetical protein
MAYIYDLADVWASSGTTFTGIKLNVTDTASSAGSLLMDLQVGGVSQFAVSKAGTLNLRGGEIYRQTASNYIETSLGWAISAGGNAGCSMQSGGFVAGPIASYAFGNSNGVGTRDLFLSRDAANTLAQRNGVNAQAFNLYNTYTDASNYERGFMKWVGNTLRIGTDALGTGSARSVEFQPGGTTQFAVGIFGPFLPATGLLQWSGRSGLTSPADGVISMRNAADNGGSALQFREQTAPAAPATDNLRIYAEDDGAGKTRLMARFATGAAVQIAIEP